MTYNNAENDTKFNETRNRSEKTGGGILAAEGVIYVLER